MSPRLQGATVDIAIWSQTEQGLAIAAGSFATLRPLFRAVLAQFGLTQSGTARQDYGTSQSAGGRGARVTGGGYKFKTTSTFGSSNLNSKNVGQNNVFGLSTFKRIDDDDVEKGGVGSTSELNSPVSPATSVDDKFGSTEDSGAVVDSKEYRVGIISRPAPPKLPHKDFETVRVSGGGRRFRGEERH